MIKKRQLVGGLFCAFILYALSWFLYDIIFSDKDIQIKSGQVWVMKFDSTDNPFELDSVFIKILRHKGNWSEFWVWDNKNKKLEPIDWNEWRSFDQKSDSSIKERFDFYSKW